MHICTHVDTTHLNLRSLHHPHTPFISHTPPNTPSPIVTPHTPHSPILTPLHLPHPTQHTSLSHPHTPVILPTPTPHALSHSYIPHSSLLDPYTPPHTLTPPPCPSLSSLRTPSLTHEGKALLLWWKTLQLLQRQVRYVGKVVAMMPHITELAQTFCRLGEDKAGWLWVRPAGGHSPRS